MTVIDEYIAQAPETARERLTELCALIRGLVPDATTEKISYGLPTFHRGTNLVHFGLQARHTGLYPGPEAVEAFAADLDAAGLGHSKGAIRLPHDQPLPVDLIRRIVAFQVERAAG